MNNGNGNGALLKWLAGIIAGLITVAVVANLRFAIESRGDTKLLLERSIESKAKDAALERRYDLLETRVRELELRRR